jgi:diacylglycerol kinase family enzyme
MQMRAASVAFADKTAFVLNANARAVTARLVTQLREIVPQGDLFLSRSLDDARSIAETIVRRGYGQVMTGGGDGTLLSTINFLEEHAEKIGAPMPKVGVLRLGTGNAVAGLMGAGDPLVDAHHIVAKGDVTVEKRNLVVTGEGLRAPFAGIGYDGDVLNDYITMKESVKNPFLKMLVTTVVGYLISMLTISVPRNLFGKKARVRVTSSKDAFKMVHGDDGDYEVRIPAGTLLYEGPAPTLAVATVPYYGFKFTMFPFAERKAGFMQLRVVAVSIPGILSKLWPAVWNGTFRHKDLHDFLVEDAVVEGDLPLAYQVGGDALGTRTRLDFRLADAPIEMVRLPVQRLKLARPSLLGAVRALLSSGSTAR